MSSYLTELLVEAHAADLENRAARAMVAPAAREAGPAPASGASI
jgi:hypothetical protein